MRINNIEQLKRCKVGCLVEISDGTRYIKVSNDVTVTRDNETYNAGVYGWNWMDTHSNDLAADDWVLFNNNVVLLFGELEPKVFEVGDEILWMDVLELPAGSIVDVVNRTDDAVLATCVVGDNTIRYAVNGATAQSTVPSEKLIVGFVYGASAGAS